ncbi:helix-turn-helix domain-containing protein [Streptomyces acidiscabies]|uniref:helix-turn-helix domain-containing protein n=1 Tax=Streptomyces acidiscabies TaxID=42234 RepID=UPI0038F60C55
MEAIPGFGFNPPLAPVPGFEIAGLGAVRERTAGSVLERVHRVGFHTVTLVTAGTGEHAVDFVTYACRPGTLLWIRPGQVQRFGAGGALDGVHLMFTAEFPPAVAGVERVVREWRGPVCRQLGTGREYAALSTLLAQLRAESTRPGQVSPEILQLLLATLLLRVDRLPGDGGEKAAGSEVYVRLRAELEVSYAVTRRAEDYARRLGYTVKTLTRACRAATGVPVKQVIDGRVALEARRLLAHTDEPVSVVARRLGFSEATNFGKFFARQAGVTPGEFRRAHQG